MNANGLVHDLDMALDYLKKALKKALDRPLLEQDIKRIEEFIGKLNEFVDDLVFG